MVTDKLKQFNCAYRLLLDIRKLIPGLQQILGPGRQLGIRRDHAQAILVFENLVADRVPPVVEQVQVADVLDPGSTKLRFE